ncbi:MAG: hypothetical protein OD814_000588 [Candidatus Alkanophagales archaeon MCA70_species_1]|nr:hypothetical protein [Candidatus Alkanophaga volatiphilum]
MVSLLWLISDAFDLPLPHLNEHSWVLLVWLSDFVEAELPDEPLSRLLPDENVHVVHFTFVAAGELYKLLIHCGRDAAVPEFGEYGLLLTKAASLCDFCFVDANEPPVDSDAEVMIPLIHFLSYLLGGHRALPPPAFWILISPWPDFFEKLLYFFSVLFAKLYNLIPPHGG